MRPEDVLFKQRMSAIVDRSGELLASAQLGNVVSAVADMITGNDVVVVTPALSHIRTAVQRALSCHGVMFPLGKVYSSGDYDECEVQEEQSDPFFDQLAKPTVVSRVYAISKPKTAGQGIRKKVKNAFSGSNTPSNQVLIHTITPNDAGQIFDVESVTFVVVRAEGGLTYCFTLKPNPNLGKVIPEVGLQSEDGDMRDIQGYIDKCPLVASEVKPGDRYYILQELIFLKSHLNIPPDVHKRPWKDTIGQRATYLSVRIRGGKPVAQTSKGL